LFLNSCHPNIKFTIETEQNNTIAFVGASFTRSQIPNTETYKYDTKIYHKPTASVLTLNFNSFSPLVHRLSIIKSGIWRILKTCSNWILIHAEIQYFRTNLLRNSYPAWVIDSNIKKTIQNFLNPKPTTIGPKKETIYFGIPFIGAQSIEIKNNIIQICNKFIPSKEFFIFFKPSSRISNLFKVKDITPLSLRSNVVYHYECTICQDGYVGQTARHLHQRVSEHRGVSHITDKEVKTKVHSKIRDHKLTCPNSKIRIEDFKILATGGSSLELLIKERLLIGQHKPKLNANAGSLDLLLY